MKTTHRNYSEASGDFNLLVRFIIEHYATVRTRSTWCIGRFVDWKHMIFDKKRAYNVFTDENAHIWFVEFG